MIRFALDELLAAKAEARASRARGLYNSKKVQYDEYDGDNDQKMDPTPGAREAWAYVPTEKAEQPQYY